jgi:cytochrome c oxidase subunit 1
MATLVTGTPGSAEGPLFEEKVNYLNASQGWQSWLFTVDHKRIALLYLFSITLMFFIGGSFAVLVRLHLTQPTGLFAPETYNRLFTMHGIVMIFFFLVPSIPATLGNFLLPIMIGAKDLAFPRINLLSWYIYIIGALFAIYAVARGGVDTGWTFYTPYSTTYSNSYVLAAAMGAFVAGFSSILTGLNFIVTVHKMRAPGMSWGRLPLFVWAHYATGLIQILGTPVVAIALVLISMERVMHVGIFDPAVGGDPILFQHIFWFYSHPAVYIMILPGMGVISEVISCFSKKRIFGYDFIAASSMGIAVLGFLVWGHHMFITGESMYTGIVFSFLSFFVAVPSAVKVFNWTATMYKGSVTFDSPMLYAFAFIGLFTIGGLTGLYLSTLATNIALHGTYFVVAHFHFVMVGAVLLGYLAGLHFWWPKMTGRMYPEFPAKVAAVTIFIGFFFTFGPQFILGYLGMPRRYAAYPPEWQMLNVFSTAGATVMGMGFFMTGIYLIWSLRFGAIAPDNPWRAAGLEWQTSSPPITQNFLEIPIVDHEAYHYDEIDALQTDTIGAD